MTLQQNPLRVQIKRWPADDQRRGERQRLARRRRGPFGISDMRSILVVQHRSTG
jgi:hypothetical protein